ncbi:MAG TPA: hypothetical protein VLI90_18500 [Tepidisphaeraceae bacterium]|nr:hypothetical protein [Tepidisphaeraceae bacterium]
MSSGQYSGFGIGGSAWPEMTAALNLATNNHVAQTSDFSSLSLMMGYDALWLDLRNTTSALTSTELSNIQSYISTGRHVVMIGENFNWTTWDNSILGLISTSVTQSVTTGTAVPIISHPLTSGVESISIPAGGSAVGGTSLFSQPVAQLGGLSNNVLAVLDVDIFSHSFWGTQSNSTFGADVANWAADAGGGNWINSTGGSWSTGTNWAVANPPGAGDDALFNLKSANGYTVSLSTNSVANKVIVQTDQLTLALGSSSLTTTSDLRVGDLTGQNGSLTITGSTGSIVTGYDVQVGGDGTGSLTQTGGTLTAGHLMYLGADATGNGTFNLQGGTVNAELYVGFDGTGTFNMSGGTFAEVGNNSLIFGYHAGSHGSGTISGTASVTTGYDVSIGASGTGTLTQTGGKLVVGHVFYVGNSTGGTGTFVLQSGTASTNGSLNLGASGGTGTVTITGGALTVGGTTNIANSASKIFLTGGTFSTGSLNSADVYRSFYDNWTGGALNLTASGLVISIIGSLEDAVVLDGTGMALSTSGDIKLGAGPNFGSLLLKNGASVTALGSSSIVIGAGDNNPGNSNATIGNGTLTAGYDLDIGLGARGTITQTDGVTTVGHSLNVGINGGTGTYNIKQNATVIAPTLYLASGSFSFGIVNISDAASLTVADVSKVFNDNSKINLSGGTFKTGSLDLGGVSSRLNWTGGTLWLTGGTITSGTTPLSVGGTFKGTGTVSGATSILAGGRVSPGDGVGTLHLADTTFAAASSLDLELGGSGAGQFDVLDVAGSVALAGPSLNVSLINGYTPPIGSSFTVITNDGSDAITGTFAGVNQGSALRVDRNGHPNFFRVSYIGGTGNDVTLTTIEMPGDANSDQKVDVGDLGVLATNYNTTAGATWAMGDFDGNGRVDVADLGALATYYGQSSADSPAPALALSSTSAVPEPAATGLAAMVVVGFGRRMRGRAGRR